MITLFATPIESTHARGRYWGLVTASVAIAFAIAVYSVAHPPVSYDNIAILPATYFVMFGIVALVSRGTPSLMLLGLNFISFLRYVLFPGLMVYNGGYEGRSWQPPDFYSNNLAIMLMAYELVAVIAVALLMEGRVKVAFQKIQPCGKNLLPLWYSLGLLVISGLLCLITPQARELVSFVRPTIVEDENASAPHAVLFAMIFVAAKVFLCVGIMERCHQYQGRFRGWMPWIALVIAAVNIMIFFGSNRLAILLNAIVSAIFLLRYFGMRAVVPVAAILAIYAVIFNIVTTEREYHDLGAPWPVEMADMIQTYTGGVYNVAIGVEVPVMFPYASDLKGLMYDFARPTIGLNVITKDWDVYYSNIYFNYRMFTHIDRRSQIMPMVAQSYLYFHPIFAPILTILFVYVGYILLVRSATVRWPEISFCILLIVLRSTFVFGNNSMNLMNFISIYLIIPVLLAAPIMLVAGQRRNRR